MTNTAINNSVRVGFEDLQKELSNISGVLRQISRLIEVSISKLSHNKTSNENYISASGTDSSGNPVAYHRTMSDIEKLERKRNKLALELEVVELETKKIIADRTKHNYVHHRLEEIV